MVTGHPTIDERLDAIERRLDNLEHKIHSLTKKEIISGIEEGVRRANHDTVAAQ